MIAAGSSLRITGRTRIVFILADPVDHVVGSALFNDHFVANGIDAAVSPLHVAAADLGLVVEAIRALKNVAGFGVTIPHKIAITAHLDAATKRASQVGAVNFVRRDGDGRLTGDNVDGVGFVAGLARNDIQIDGKAVCQLGAGGAGRSIAFALAEAGAARITIVNRTPDKARALAEAVRASYPACDCRAGDLDLAGIGLLVNTTSVGLRGEDTPVGDLTGLPREAAVAEIIMTPETTRLLRDAEARGHRVMRGRAMLAEQLRLASRFMGLEAD